MKKLTMFHVRLNLEELHQIELPGNMLSAILASDFFPQAVSQMKLIQNDMPQAGKARQDPSRGWSLFSEPITPSVQATTGNRSRLPVALTNEEGARTLADFRSNGLIDGSFDSLSTRNAEQPSAQNGIRDDSALAALVTVLSLNPVPTQVSSNDVVRQGNDEPITLVKDNSELETLTEYVRSYQPVRSPSGNTQALSGIGGGEGGNGGDNVLRQDVPINANDDNGSDIVDYIPQKYDFEVVTPLTSPDPELVPLQLVLDTSFGLEEGTPIGYTDFKLNVTQPSQPSGGGHIRFWDSQTKDHELTVLNEWTQVGMTPSLLHPGYFEPLTVYMEGTEPSLADDEITVSFSIKLATTLGVETSSYQAVKATVTPRIETFKVEPPPISKMFWRPNPQSPSVPGNDIKYGYAGYGEFTGILRGNLLNATPKFLQDLTKCDNQLDGKAGLKLTDDTYRKKVFNDGGEEYDMPLLDSDEMNAPYYPIYQKLDGSESYNGPDPNDARKYLMKSSDSPGLRYNNDNILIKRVEYKYEFKLWLVLSYSNAENKKTMYPLAVTGWKVQFEADTYIVGRGVTNNTGSVIPDTTYQITHAKPDQVKPPFAADLQNWVKVP